MISLTRADGSRTVLNADLIETVEATPDAVIRLTTQRSLLVRESHADVVVRAIRFCRLVAQSHIALKARARGC